MAHVHAAQPGVVRSSWRLRFAYRDDEIWPVAATRVAMTAPGGTPPPPQRKGGAHSGAWVELSAKGRETGWARTIGQPNRADVEGFTEKGGITRVRKESAEGEFELIVPDFGPDARFVLHSSPAHKPEAAAEPRLDASLAELARLEPKRRPDPPGDGRPRRGGKKGK